MSETDREPVPFVPSWHSKASKDLALQMKPNTQRSEKLAEMERKPGERTMFQKFEAPDIALINCPERKFHTAQGPRPWLVRPRRAGQGLEPMWNERGFGIRSLVQGGTFT